MGQECSGRKRGLLAKSKKFFVTQSACALGDCSSIDDAWAVVVAEELRCRTDRSSRDGKRRHPEMEEWNRVRIFGGSRPEEVLNFCLDMEQMRAE